ncbi:MAG: hypothetical protein HY291_11500 [Planctomycetes bacterium]|nr:hypothetical protein [Planctomycetota bacterium]
MFTNAVQCIPPRRRDQLYCEIQKIVEEVAAVDRSLEGIGEGIAVDEALESITELLTTEVSRARRRSRKTLASV